MPVSLLASVPPDERKSCMLADCEQGAYRASQRYQSATSEHPKRGTLSRFISDLHRNTSEGVAAVETKNDPAHVTQTPQSGRPASVGADDGSGRGSGAIAGAVAGGAGEARALSGGADQAGRVRGSERLASPSEARAIIRQRLAEQAAYERDPNVFAVLRELIRALAPAAAIVVIAVHHLHILIRAGVL